jgi:hypothetical protein
MVLIHERQQPRERHDDGRDSAEGGLVIHIPSPPAFLRLTREWSCAGINVSWTTSGTLEMVKRCGDKGSLSEST